MRFEAPSRGNLGPPAWVLSPGWRYEALVFLALLVCFSDVRCGAVVRQIQFKMVK